MIDDGNVVTDTFRESVEAALEQPVSSFTVLCGLTLASRQARAQSVRRVLLLGVWGAVLAVGVVEAASATNCSTRG